MSQPKNGKYIKNANYNLFESFKFAFEGIVFALFWERNLRIHVSLAGYLIYFSNKYYDFDNTQVAILILTIIVVVTAELFNTAIEKTVDLVTKDYAKLAKIAKDVAAGAVLTTAIASIAVGLLFFWDIDILKIVLADVIDYWFVWLPLIIINLTIIFLPEFNRKRSR